MVVVDDYPVALGNGRRRQIIQGGVRFLVAPLATKHVFALLMDQVGQIERGPV